MSSSHFGCCHKETPRKMENQQDYPSWQCSSTPVDFGQGFLGKEWRDNKGVAFHKSPWKKSALKGRRFLWCYWRHWECQGRNEQAFKKCFPKMISTPVQSCENYHLSSKEEALQLDGNPPLIRHKSEAPTYLKYLSLAHHNRRRVQPADLPKRETPPPPYTNNSGHQNSYQPQPKTP